MWEGGGALSRAMSCPLQTGAAKGNYENLVVSCSGSLARRFGGEFERLWEAFGRGDPGKARRS